MTTTTTPTTATRDRTDPTPLHHHLAARVAASVLAVLVTVIHVSDQGGLTALKEPAYVGQGYRLLELAGVVVAVLLLLAPMRQRFLGWLLALGVAVGPIVGFVLSRGPGLPSYVDDKGNWTELLGLQALTVEAVLLTLAGVVVLARRARS